MFTSSKSTVNPSYYPQKKSLLTKKRLVQVGKVLVILLVIVVPIVAIQKLKNRNQNGAKTVANATDPAVLGATSSTDINREINIPIPAKAGEEEDPSKPSLVFHVTNAEKRKTIVVQGQNQTAIPGRIFLILNLTLTNNLDKGLTINTRDYVRMQIDDSGEWLAPDIHNDPVEVQAISTKFTRLGFPVNENDTHFTLRLGEIKGEKVEIPFDL